MCGRKDKPPLATFAQLNPEMVKSGCPWAEALRPRGWLSGALLLLEVLGHKYFSRVHGLLWLKR